MAKLPSFLKRYFWDIDFKKLDSKKNSEYIIVRLLEFGDEKAIRWLLKIFSKKLIKKIVMTRRGISPRTATFWGRVLGVSEKDILCLQTQYLKMRRAHWPY